jgi:hypothetical protein
MAKTKSKKKKTANPVATIARKTVGLMARVGDALEAVAAAAVPATAVPPAVFTVARDVAMPVVTAADRDDARAIEAVEAYVAAHNLRAIDMPSRATLVDALTGGMVRHGSKFTDSHVLSLLDEQMRIHLRTLGARTVTPPPATGS